MKTMATIDKDGKIVVEEIDIETGAKAYAGVICVKQDHGIALRLESQRKILSRNYPVSWTT